MVAKLAGHGRVRQTEMRVIDSHTEGEPTRVVVEGGPELGDGSMRERIERFASDFDDVRRFARRRTAL